jgi:hypothetical protein
MIDSRLVLTMTCAAAELFACSRLFETRVYRSYPWFQAYLVAGFLQSFIWLAGSPDTEGYLRAYRWTTPFVMALQVMTVLELWRALMSCYRGIHRISHALGGIILLLAIVVASSTGFDGLAMRHESLARTTFHWLMWAVRYTGSILSVACVLLAAWAGMFDHGVPPNRIRHAELLSGYFGSIAIGYLLLNLHIGTADTIGICTTLTAAGFYIAWGVLLDRAGEIPFERLMIGRRSKALTSVPWLRRLIPY